jgi:hypothetical protein
MKRTYLNRYGQIVKISHKELGASWTQMNEAHVSSVTKEEKDYLEKYGLKTTIFNVANLRKYDHVYLTEHYVKVALEHGATMRDEQ